MSLSKIVFSQGNTSGSYVKESKSNCNKRFDSLSLGFAGDKENDPNTANLFNFKKEYVSENIDYIPGNIQKPGNENDKNTSALTALGLAALGFGTVVAGILIKRRIRAPQKLLNSTGKIRGISAQQTRLAQTGIIGKNSGPFPKTGFKSVEEYITHIKSMKDSGGYARYLDDEISKLADMYKENPDFVEFLSLKQGRLKETYNAYQIEDILNLHKTNPECVEHFVLNPKYNGDLYTARDIELYLQLHKKNASLTEELFLDSERFKFNDDIETIVDKYDSNPNIRTLLDAKFINEEGKTVYAYSGSSITRQMCDASISNRESFLLGLNDSFGYKLFGEDDVKILLKQGDGCERANLMIDFCIQNPEYSKILKLFVSNLKNLKFYEDTLFYTVDDTGKKVVNKKMCDFYMKYITANDIYYSVESAFLDNFYEMKTLSSNGRKIIRFQLDKQGNIIENGCESVIKNKENTEFIEHLFKDGSSIKQTVKYNDFIHPDGSQITIGTAHKKEVFDSSKKLVYSEEISPNLSKSGEYDIVVESNGEKHVAGYVRQYGSKSQGSRVGRHLTSTNGTVTRQVKIEGSKGRSSRYIITGKDGNEMANISRKQHKISENHYTSSVNNEKYDILFSENEIVITKSDISTNCSQTIKLTSEDVDFESISLYKNLPGDFLFRLKELGIKVKKFPHCKEIDSCGGAYYSAENNLIAITEPCPFVFAHEFGHALDYTYLKELSKDSNLLAIYEKELEIYKSHSTNTEGLFINYFTNRVLYHSEENCLAELIAETNALLSGLPVTQSSSELLGLRSITLQQHFPETITYIAKRLS